MDGSPFAYQARGKLATEGINMCLATLHDKARNLGLGRMYEKHWGRGGFRDLFDLTSADWSGTAVAEKIIDLKAFESAGLPVGELIEAYRETYAREGDGGRRVLANLAATLRAYHDAGFRPHLPDDLAAMVHGLPA